MTVEAQRTSRVGLPRNRHESLTPSQVLRTIANFNYTTRDRFSRNNYWCLQQPRSSCSWNALESTLPVRLRTTTVTDVTGPSFLQVRLTRAGADRWPDVDQCSGKLICSPEEVLEVWNLRSWTRDGARV